VVCIFDKDNEEKARKCYKIKRLYNLADFVDYEETKVSEIDDPWGKGEEDVDYCYNLIANVIGNAIDHYLLPGRVRQ